VPARRAFPLAPELGSSRTSAEYLIAEMLERQPEKVRQL